MKGQGLRWLGVEGEPGLAEEPGDEAVLSLDAVQPVECHYTRLPLTFMDPSPIVSMDALWPELPRQRRPFEVVVTVPREDGGEPLVPHAMPPQVLSCWSADQVGMELDPVLYALAS